MQKVFTNSIAPKDQELKEGPKRASLDLILAFSKSVEVKKSSHNQSVCVHLN